MSNQQNISAGWLSTAIFQVRVFLHWSVPQSWKACYLERYQHEFSWGTLASAESAPIAWRKYCGRVWCIKYISLQSYEAQGSKSTSNINDVTWAVFNTLVTFHSAGWLMGCLHFNVLFPGSRIPYGLSTKCSHDLLLILLLRHLPIVATTTVSPPVLRRCSRGQDGSSKSVVVREVWSDAAMIWYCW